MLEQITASAGSGKTYTLIRRFLELLAASGPEGEAALRDLAQSGPRPHAWPEILAATFTNAAASEMKERLVRELKAYALAEEAPATANAPHSPTPPPSGTADTAAAPAPPRPLFTPGEAKERLDVILRRFGSLNIRTIDSLLTMLVRLSALDLGLPPDFTPVFGEGLPEHFELFFDETQELARAGNATVHGLLLDCCQGVMADERRGGFMAPADFTPTLLGLILHFWEQGAPRNLTSDAALAAAQQALRAEVGQATLALHSSISLEDLECDKRFLNFLDKLGAWSGRGLAEPADAASDSATPGSVLPASVYTQRPALAACLNKHSAQPSEQAEATFSLWQFAVSQAGPNLARLAEARRILPYARLAAHLAGPFQAWLAEQGLIPSDLLGGYARQLLERDLGPSEAYCRFGARLEHLLMDEFQDTSRAQWRSIAPLAEECLASGGHVIHVGDVKQAIYSWRGGDAALFQEIAADPDLTRSSGRADLTVLPANWRSLGRIVELNNTVFTALKDEHTALEVARTMLGKDCPDDVAADTARDLASTFGQAGQTLPPQRQALTQRGYVRLVRLNEQDGQGEQDGQDNALPSEDDPDISIYYAEAEDETAAEAGAPEVRGAGDAGDELSGYAELGEAHKTIYRHLRAMLLDDILLRRPPGEVAILTRGNEAARILARWLTAWGVPVVTENSLLLSEHPLIQQIVAFLKFMDNPLDDPAVFEFLCTQDLFLAMSGLAAQDLRHWLLSLPNKNEHLLTAVRRDFPEAWAHWAAPFYQQAGLMSAYDLTCEMLRHFKVWERLPATAVFLRRFLELLHGAEERDMHSLPEFLDWWAAPDNAEKLPVAESLNAVRIMTMHKAKGLEFPVVIAPFNNFPIKAGGHFQRVTLAGGQAVLKDRKAFGQAYFRNLSLQVREGLHLVYVAWTRAAEEFYALLPLRQGEDAQGQGSGKKGSPGGVSIAKALDILLAGLPFADNGVYEAGQPEARQGTLPVYSATPQAQPQPQTQPHPQTQPTQEFPTAPSPEGTPPPPPPVAPPAAAPGTSPAAAMAARPAATPDAPMAWLPRLKIYRNVHEAGGGAARERGILIHNCLENLRFAGHAPEAVFQAALAAFMHARRVLNLPRLEEGLYQDIMGLLTWVLSLPEAGQWFAAGRPEQEMLTPEGGRKIADRLIVSDQGCQVLEYKTGGLDLPPADLPLPEHVAQVRSYLAALKDMRLGAPPGQGGETNAPGQGGSLTGHIIYLDRREIYAVPFTGAWQ